MSVLIVWGICGILIFLVTTILFRLSVLPKIKNKKLSFVMNSLGLNVISTPLSLFIGIMATASPFSTAKDFWIGFLIVQSVPLLILIIAILKWIIIDIRKINKYINSDN